MLGVRGTRIHCTCISAALYKQRISMSDRSMAAGGRALTSPELLRLAWDELSVMAGNAFANSMQILEATESRWTGSVVSPVLVHVISTGRSIGRFSGRYSTP